MPKTDVIKESELASVLALREETKDKRKALAASEARLEGAEKEISDRLKDGATCKGKLVASIEMVGGQCRPAWKDHHIEHMVTVHGMAAKAAEEGVRTKYPPEPSEKLSIGYKTGDKK